MAVWSFMSVLMLVLLMVPQEALGHGWLSMPASRHLCNIRKLGRFTMGGGLSKRTFLCMIMSLLPKKSLCEQSHHGPERRDSGKQNSVFASAHVRGNNSTQGILVGSPYLTMCMPECCFVHCYCPQCCWCCFGWVCLRWPLVPAPLRSVGCLTGVVSTPFI